MSDDEIKLWIYVGGLPYELTEGDIVCVFSQYGELCEISLARDKETGRSRGFCFLKYEDPKSCELAVDNLNGANVVNRRIKVHYANNLGAIKASRPTNIAPGVDSKLPVVEERREDKKFDRMLPAPVPEVKEDRIKHQDEMQKYSSRSDDRRTPHANSNPSKYDRDPKRDGSNYARARSRSRSPVQSREKHSRRRSRSYSSSSSSDSSDDSRRRRKHKKKHKHKHSKKSHKEHKSKHHHKHKKSSRKRSSSSVESTPSHSRSHRRRV